jgi:hypothetical protein
MRLGGARRANYARSSRSRGEHAASITSLPPTAAATAVYSTALGFYGKRQGDGRRHSQCDAMRRGIASRAQRGRCSRCVPMGVYRPYWTRLVPFPHHRQCSTPYLSASTNGFPAVVINGEQGSLQATGKGFFVKPVRASLNTSAAANLRYVKKRRPSATQWVRRVAISLLNYFSLGVPSANTPGTDGAVGHLPVPCTPGPNAAPARRVASFLLS